MGKRDELRGLKENVIVGRHPRPVPAWPSTRRARPRKPWTTPSAARCAMQEAEELAAVQMAQASTRRQENGFRSGDANQGGSACQPPQGQGKGGARPPFFARQCQCRVRWHDGPSRPTLRLCAGQRQHRILVRPGQRPAAFCIGRSMKRWSSGSLRQRSGAGVTAWWRRPARRGQCNRRGPAADRTQYGGRPRARRWRSSQFGPSSAPTTWPDRQGSDGVDGVSPNTSQSAARWCR